MVSPGRGEDQTRQAVPLPRRSITWTELSRSAEGNTAIELLSDQALPDWLNHALTPSSPT